MPTLPFDFAARAQPADGLRSVASFVAKGIEVAFGIAASAHILDDDVVAVGGKPDGVSVDHGRRNIPAIRLAHEQGRVRPGLRRVVVIGDQDDAVRHGAVQGAFETNAGAAVDHCAHDSWLIAGTKSLS